MSVIDIGDRAQILAEYPSVVAGCVVRLVRRGSAFYSERVVNGRVDEDFTHEVKDRFTVEQFIRQATESGHVYADPPVTS